MDVIALPPAFPFLPAKANRPLTNDVQTIVKFIVGKLYACPSSSAAAGKPALIKYLTLGMDLHVESTIVGHLLHTPVLINVGADQRLNGIFSGSAAVLIRKKKNFQQR